MSVEINEEHLNEDGSPPNFGLDSDGDDEHCGDACTGAIDEAGEWNPDEADGLCVHCECCCSCLACEYGPRDGMLMNPANA